MRRVGIFGVKPVVEVPLRARNGIGHVETQLRETRRADRHEQRFDRAHTSRVVGDPSFDEVAARQGPGAGWHETIIARPAILPYNPGVSNPQSMSLAAGTRLGAYEIVALIGAGGMGLAALTRGINRLADLDCQIGRLPIRRWH